MHIIPSIPAFLHSFSRRCVEGCDSEGRYGGPIAVYIIPSEFVLSRSLSPSWSIVLENQLLQLRQTICIILPSSTFLTPSPSQNCSTIKTSLGDLPFFTEEEAPTDTNESKPAPASVTPVVSSKRPAVLADGTYATQSAAVELAAVAPVTTLAAAAAAAANLRALLLTGDFFLGSVIATTLTKLVLRLEELHANKVGMVHCWSCFVGACFCGVGAEAVCGGFW